MQNRQGDVLIETCDPKEIEGAKKTAPTLALGEVTGHHHSFEGKHVTGFFKEGAADHTIAGGSALAQFVQIVGKSGALKHQEHGTIMHPPGTYKKTQQVEYSPESIRNVAD
jgi:hypothetical protein